MTKDSGIGKGKIADVKDLLNPDFGKSFHSRFEDGGKSKMAPRKLWELCWIADRVDEIAAKKKPQTMLGLGVGLEPLIYHFSHLAEQVIATDLYHETGSWVESRTQPSAVYDASPFPYPRDHLVVKNMDMRELTQPDNSVDVVWSCSSVEHVSTLTEFIQIFREVHRVLAPGGHAVITTEFSLDETYFLPGVLSLWSDSALFKGGLKGLSLATPVDLQFDDMARGNTATVRKDTHRVTHMYDLDGGPTGICLHAGYTRLAPVGFVLQKTGADFEWPPNLDAPAWYASFSRGLVLFGDRANSQAAANEFEKALKQATSSGARLHCLRFYIDALANIGDLPALNTALDHYAAEMYQLPDDNDALDLIAFVAANQQRYLLAQRIWERAHNCRGAVPISRLAIRFNQLEAVLRWQGASSEAYHLNTLIEVARFEVLGFHGAADSSLIRLSEKIIAVRNEYGLPHLEPISTAPAPSSSPSSISVQNPHFDVMASNARSMVYLGDNLALTKTVYGHKMYVDTRSQVGACFLMDGYWEEWIFRQLKNYVKPGMHAIDIGANMGFYTLALCDLVGPSGHVTAFEPWPEYFEIMRRNVEVNGFLSRSTLVQKGVYQKTGKKKLHFSKSYGTGSILETVPLFFRRMRKAQSGNYATIKTVALDDYLRENSHKVDFIKIDVDGGEAFVLAGMRKLLASSQPLTIFCEFSPFILHKLGINPQGFIDDLRKARFEISHITPNGILPYHYNGKHETDWVELLLVRN